MGAGNGTLMLNILDYLAQYEPKIYQSVQYKIIEISPRLAEQQAIMIRKRHCDKVKIINQSIFEWKQVVPEPCYFVAMEVIVMHIVY